MKKVFVPIISLIISSILSYVVFTNTNLLSENKALDIGEEKYLEFLWIVDGAFNSERFDSDYLVNGKSLSNDNKTFTCKYKNKNDKECLGNNLDIMFKSLFSNKITYDNVYSDGAIYTWYYFDNGKFIFNNLDNCQINRMPLNQEIKIIKIESDKITYQVSYENSKSKEKNYQDFILILENNEWKIVKAYYHDLCEMDYHIE